LSGSGNIALRALAAFATLWFALQLPAAAGADHRRPPPPLKSQPLRLRPNKPSETVDRGDAAPLEIRERLSVRRNSQARKSLAGLEAVRRESRRLRGTSGPHTY
jgi:hypothetical protein